MLRANWPFIYIYMTLGPIKIIEVVNFRSHTLIIYITIQYKKFILDFIYFLYLYNYSFFILLSIFESLDTVNNKVTHDCNFDNLHYVCVRFARLRWVFAFSKFFFFFQPHNLTFQSLFSHTSGSRVLFTESTNLIFQQFFLLKMGLKTLFTHLKIILLQCFQFLVFSCIQLGPIQI